VQSQSWRGKVSSRDDPRAHPTHPPEPGLGYLCLLLVKLEKKVSLSGTAVDRADRPVGWSRRVAGTIFIYLLVLCIRIRAFKCVNVSPAWPLRFGLFGLFSAQKSGPSARTALIVFSGFGHKKCAKKRFVPRRGQSTRRGQIIQAQKGQGWDIFEVGAEIVSSSVTYHNGSRGRTHPATTGLT